jgi:hypothetical protein
VRQSFGKRTKNLVPHSTDTARDIYSVPSISIGDLNPMIKGWTSINK